MTALTPEERGELADRLLPIAAKLACIVHGDGDHHDVHHHTRKLDRTELIALTVVLAGLIDPDQPLADALGYITWDEHGRPAQQRITATGTIRSLTVRVCNLESLGAESILQSERRQLARELHLGQGYTITEVAHRLGASTKTIQNWATGWAA